jgi:hypothetical protein
MPFLRDPASRDDLETKLLLLSPGTVTTVLLSWLADTIRAGLLAGLILCRSPSSAGTTTARSHCRRNMHYLRGNQSSINYFEIAVVVSSKPSQVAPIIARLNLPSRHLPRSPPSSVAFRYQSPLSKSSPASVPGPHRRVAWRPSRKQCYKLARKQQRAIRHRP